MVINTSLCVLVCCVGIQSLVWPCWQLTPCSKSSQVVKPRPQVFMASFKLRSKSRNKLLIVTNTATSCLLIAQYKRANADTFMKAWVGCRYVRNNGQGTRGVLMSTLQVTWRSMGSQPFISCIKGRSTWKERFA